MNKTRVELVLEALGIEAVQRGKQLWAKCPNVAHNDRHPSWRIRNEPGSPKDGYHACPPCGFEGGLVGLIAYTKGCDFRDARGLLERIEKGIAVEKKSVPSSVSVIVKRPGFILPPGTRFAPECPLSAWPRMAREYALGPKRRITPEQIDKWRIGFADEGRLAHRIVLVTRDAKGIARNYTARTYVNHPKRYFEPEHWEKADRNFMFGEERWNQSNRFDCVVVTEGAFKSLAVERAAPDVALATTSGSAVMPGYPIKLSRFAHVIVSTDANHTGDLIADELMFMLKRQRVPCTRMRLREGTEHDEIEIEELREILRWARSKHVA